MPRLRQHAESLENSPFPGSERNSKRRKSAPRKRHQLSFDCSEELGDMISRYAKDLNTKHYVVIQAALEEYFLKRGLLKVAG